MVLRKRIFFVHKKVTLLASHASSLNTQRSQGKRRVIYGTSELMSSKAFLDQLATLGASLQ